MKHHSNPRWPCRLTEASQRVSSQKRRHTPLQQPLQSIRQDNQSPSQHRTSSLATWQQMTTRSLTSQCETYHQASSTPYTLFSLHPCSRLLSDNTSHFLFLPSQGTPTLRTLVLVYTHRSLPKVNSHPLPYRGGTSQGHCTPLTG